MRLILASILLLVSVQANATPIISTSGLTNPTTTIDFGVSLFPLATGITDQFAASGVIFGPRYGYGDTGVQQSNFSGGILFAIDRFLQPGAQPGSISFTGDVIAASFAWVTNPGSTTFEAYHNDVLVEAFSATTNTVDFPVGIFGFTGILFDEIRFTIEAGTIGFQSGGGPIVIAENTDFGLDNVRYIVASSVPEPTTLTLFATDLAGLGFMMRRRRST